LHYFGSQVHEIGHAIGIGSLPFNNSAMTEILDESPVLSLQQKDVEAIEVQILIFKTRF